MSNSYKYNSLSMHLKTTFKSINEDVEITNESLITEGIFDSIKYMFKGGKAPSGKQEGEAKGLFGWIGGFTSIFVGSSDDPLLKKYNEIADKEAKDEEDRLKKELDAENNLEIERLEAEYQQKKNQMDIKSKNKIEAINANKRRLKELQGRIKENKLLFTAEQNEQMLKQIREAGKNLAIDDASPLKQMQDLATLIVTRPDGTVRSKEEIFKDAENDPELQKHIDSYNAIAKKIKKSTLEKAMSSKEFKKSFKVAQNTILDQADLSAQLKEAETEMDDYTEKANAVARVQAIQKEYDTAEEALKKKKDALDSATKKENVFGTYNAETGEVAALDKDNIKTKIAEIAGNIKYNPTGNKIDIAALRADLKAAGIPDNILNKIVPESTESNLGELDVKAIKNNMDSSDISDDEWKEIGKKTADAAQKKIKSAKSAVEAAEKTLSTKVNMSKFDDPNLSEDERTALEKTLKDNYSNPSDNSQDGLACLEVKNNIPKEELETYDGTTDVGKARKKETEDKLKNRQDAVKQNELNIETNKKALAAAADNVKWREENEMPEDLKDKIEKKLDGLEMGELLNDGKIGFMDDDGNFHEKPGPNSTPDEKDKYYNDRERYALTTNTEEHGSPIASIKKGKDGKYIVTPKKGESYEVDADKAVELKANMIAANRSQAQIIDRKQKAADLLKSCVKDGKLDNSKFKEILDKATKDGATEDDKKDYETLMFMLSANKPEDLFKGIDIDGDVTSEEIAKALKGSKDDINKYIEDFEDNAYKDKMKDKKANASDDEEDDEDDEYEDVEDEDEDAKDENDYDSDEEDEETAKNADGDKLVKKDGKWYKESDLDEDGNPKPEAETQENVSKKKIKNPAKEWKKKKRNSGSGTTKSYYNKDGESISEKEYKQKMNAYKKAKAKGKVTEQKYSQLKNYLIEMFG